MYLALLSIIIICLVVYLICSCRENLGFPFNELRTTPEAVTRPPYHQPYCMNEHGQPVPCPIPCQDISPTCDHSFPVPVFSNKIGSYMPHKWTPGTPMS